MREEVRELRMREEVREITRVKELKVIVLSVYEANNLMDLYNSKVQENKTFSISTVFSKHIRILINEHVILDGIIDIER